MVRFTDSYIGHSALMKLPQGISPKEKMLHIEGLMQDHVIFNVLAI